MRDKREIEIVIEDLSKLAVYARERAYSLSNKSSRLFDLKMQVASLAERMLVVKHYPTIGCLARIKLSITWCMIDELETTVREFRKILNNVQ